MTPTPPSNTPSSGARSPEEQFRVIRKRNRVPLSCYPCRTRKSVLRSTKDQSRLITLVTNMTLSDCKRHLAVEEESPSTNDTPENAIEVTRVRTVSSVRAAILHPAHTRHLPHERRTKVKELQDPMTCRIVLTV
jgi:hypothetical protein